MSVDENSELAEAPPVLGIDLGGTQIRAAVVQGTRMRGRAATPTGHEATPERVLPRLYATMEEALREAGVAWSGITGIGVAAPGPLNNRTGVIYSPPNLPTWDAVPLREILNQYTGCPVYVENDANAAALGEYLFGAGQGCRDMVYLTVSTGIGGGVIANGQLVEGINGSAGELGHMTIDWRGERCACGNIGCLEALASGVAIARKANRAIAEDQGAELLAFARAMLEHPTTVPDKQALPQLDPTTQPLDAQPPSTGSQPPAAEEELTVTAYTVARAAEAGIPLARALLAEAAQALGFGLVNILHIFSPEIVVLGGGVMQAGASLMEPAVKIVREHTMRANREQTRIVLAQLGGNAGLIGAGVLPSYYQRHDLTRGEKRGYGGE